jgi:hypothetical protein
MKYEKANFSDISSFQTINDNFPLEIWSTKLEGKSFAKV